MTKVSSLLIYARQVLVSKLDHIDCNFDQIKHTYLRRYGGFTPRRTQMKRPLRLRQDQLLLPFNESLGDICGNKKALAIACVSFVENARKRNSVSKYPIPGENLSSIPAPSFIKEHISQAGVIIEGFDVRIFMDKDGNKSDSFVLASTVMESNGEIRLVPYSFGISERVQKEYVFDDGYTNMKIIAESVDEAKQMWEEKVPENERSSNTRIVLESRVVDSTDPIGPFLIETSDGSFNAKNVKSVIQILSQKNGNYKVYDENHSLFIEHEILTPSISMIDPQAIFEARSNNQVIAYIRDAKGNIGHGICAERLTEGSGVLFEGINGEKIYATVVEASRSFALLESKGQKDVHIDLIRTAKPIRMLMRIDEGLKESPKTNHRVIVESGCYKGMGGVVVPPCIDEYGIIKSGSGAGRTFNKLTECFVRMDNGDLTVVPAKQLSKA
jgi:hypothetical protein